MKLYGIVISVCMAIIALAAALFGAPALGFSPLYAVIATLFGTAAVIAQDGLFAFLLRRLPEKWFAHTHRIFAVSAREKAFYEKLGIRKWKEKIPELGGFTHFGKGKIERPRDNEYLARFMLEANYGVMIHIVTAFTGFCIVFLFPLRYCLCFGIPIAAVNFVLNLLPAFTLRFNTYSLRLLYRHNEKTALRRESERQAA